MVLRDAYYSGGTYFRTLASARAGNLLYLVLATAFVWTWLSRRVNRFSAVVGTMMFTTTPVVLGHAGIATNDMAVTAMLAWWIDCFVKWIDRPSLGSGAMMGLVGAAAVLSKFSAPILFLATAPAIVLARSLFIGWGTSIVQYCRSLPMCFVVSFIVVWAVYLFSVGPMEVRSGYSTAIRAMDEASNGDDFFASALSKVKTISVPAPEFFQGILCIAQKEEDGHAAYFMGKRSRNEGNWLFFPILLITRTPIPFLLCVAIGIVVCIRSAKAKSDWSRVVPIVVPACFLVLVCWSDINLGLRHLLPAFPFLAIVAGQGLASIASGRLGLRVLAAILLASQILASALVHPDYLPYFNVLARGRPEEIAVDSDLDWGQDLQRLGDECKRLEINEIYLSYFGTADTARHGLPRIREIPGDQQVGGWVAISLFNLKTKPQYFWLDKQSPWKPIGKSIRLYDFRGRPESYQDGVPTE